ncbi:MAG: DUF5674 family protein [Patescibacteria group bacterium]
MKIIKQPLNKASIFENSIVIDDEYVKAVVDVTKELIAYDAGMHFDLEQMLLEQGSRQEDLWGINLLKNMSGDDWIEFDSMINIRPAQNNRSRRVEDENARKTIVNIINKLFI